MTKQKVDILKEIIFQSGDIARKFFRNTDLFETKQDGSGVTVADREIEQFIKAQLEVNFPDIPVFGEELENLPQGNLQPDNFFIIDPIDGTSSFIAGKPSFTTLLGYVENGKAEIGVIYQPILQELWLAYDDICEYYYGNLSQSPQILSNQSEKYDNCMTLATTSPDLLDEKGKSFFNSLKSKCDNVVFGGDAYNYGMLASGHIDIIFEQDLKKHDFIPLIAILKNSGCFLNSSSGEKIEANYEGKDFLASKSSQKALLNKF